MESCSKLILILPALPSLLLIFLFWYFKNRFISEIAFRVEESFTSSIARLKREAELPFDEKIAVYHVKLSHIMELNRDRRILIKEYLLDLASMIELLQMEIFDSSLDIEMYQKKIEQAYFKNQIREELLLLYVNSNELPGLISDLISVILEVKSKFLKDLLSLRKVYNDYEFNSKRLDIKMESKNPSVDLENVKMDYENNSTKFNQSRNEIYDAYYSWEKDKKLTIHEKYRKIVNELRREVLNYSNSYFNEVY